MVSSGVTCDIGSNTYQSYIYSANNWDVVGTAFDWNQDATKQTNGISLPAFSAPPSSLTLPSPLFLSLLLPSTLPFHSPFCFFSSSSFFYLVSVDLNKDGLRSTLIGGVNEYDIMRFNGGSIGSTNTTTSTTKRSEKQEVRERERERDREGRGSERRVYTFERRTEG